MRTQQSLTATPAMENERRGEILRVAMEFSGSGGDRHMQVRHTHLSLARRRAVAILPVRRVSSPRHSVVVVQRIAVRSSEHSCALSSPVAIRHACRSGASCRPLSSSVSPALRGARLHVARIREAVRTQDPPGLRTLTSLRSTTVWHRLLPRRGDGRGSLDWNRLMTSHP